MTDTSKGGTREPEMQTAGSGERLDATVTVCVVTLCVVVCALMFLLPGDSLVVDLVYQGF
jgi:hypothetical protein